MILIKNPRYQFWFFVLLGCCFYFPFLGTVRLFDWDEINFAESAREMLLTGEYFRVQINFEPFWEKPPLFFWFQALSMKVFGVGEFAARFPNAVMGVVTLVTVYSIGKKLYDSTFGAIWALLYFCSILPMLYFKSGIIDPFFNYFIFLGVYFLAETVAAYGQSQARKYALLAGLFIGLAVLTKGPVGFLLLLLTFLAYWVSDRLKPVGSIANIALFALAAFAVTFLWFGVETVKNGFWFLQEFVVYQIRLFSTPDAGHGQPFYYHFVVVFLGCFPASVFALKSFWFKAAPDRIHFRRWMLYLFWVVMILFSIVKTKIVHYSSMSYFPVTFLGAYHVYYIYTGKLKPERWIGYVLAFLGVLYGILFSLPITVGLYKEQFIPYIKDAFAVACLQQNVPWRGIEYLIVFTYSAFIISALVYWLKARLERAVLQLCFATALFVFVYMAAIVPKVDKYVQAAPAKFYESLQGQDVYVHTVGFKSYAHYFYFRKPGVSNRQSRDQEWLLHGHIDKPVYFVTRINKPRDLDKIPDIQHLKNEGGFSFWLRKPKEN